MGIKQRQICAGLEYLLMLMTVLYSSVWALFTGAQSNTFARAVIAVLGVLLLLQAGRLSWRNVRPMLAVMLIFVIYLFFTRHNLVRCALYLALPFCLFTLYPSRERLILKLSDIMAVLSCVSLVLFLFGTLLRILPGSSEVTVYWGESQRVFKTYYHLLYESQEMVLFGHSFMRNCSIFPEAPGFAAYLTVAVAAELFLRDRISYARLIVLLLASLTTFSAKAWLLAAAALVLRVLLIRTRSRFAVLGKGALVCIVLAGGALLLYDKAKDYSFHIRLDDLMASLKTFAEQPLFGAGYYNDSAIIAHFTYAYRANNGLSMGLAVLLAQGGLWLTLFYLLSALRAVHLQPRRKRAEKTCFALIFFGMLFITNLPFGMVTVAVISSFAAADGNRKEVKRWRNKA